MRELGFKKKNKNKVCLSSRCIFYLCSFREQNPSQFALCLRKINARVCPSATRFYLYYIRYYRGDTVVFFSRIQRDFNKNRHSPVLSRLQLSPATADSSDITATSFAGARAHTDAPTSARTNSRIYAVFNMRSCTHSLSLSLCIRDIYIDIRGTPERGKFGCNNPKLLSCRLSVDPHFSKYLQSSPDPSRPFKGFPRLNEGKR